MTRGVFGKQGGLEGTSDSSICWGFELNKAGRAVAFSAQVMQEFGTSAATCMTTILLAACYLHGTAPSEPLVDHLRDAACQLPLHP